MNQQYLKHLIVLAYSDGIIMDQEFHILKAAAIEAGVSSDELDYLMKNVEHINTQFPDDNDEREELLINMIKMATADGIFTKEEYYFCRLLADKIDSPGLKRSLKISMTISNYKNLVALAWADGVMHEKEVKILKDAAKEVGLSEDDIGEIMHGSHEFLPFIPETEEEKEVQLIQMINIAISDGNFSREEYKLCKLVATRLGFSEDELKMIIQLSYKGPVSFS